MQAYLISRMNEFPSNLLPSRVNLSVEVGNKGLHHWAIKVLNFHKLLLTFLETIFPKHGRKNGTAYGEESRVNFELLSISNSANGHIGREGRITPKSGQLLEKSFTMVYWNDRSRGAVPGVDKAII